jgi:hypothetical protein
MLYFQRVDGRCKSIIKVIESDRKLHRGKKPVPGIPVIEQETACMIDVQ